MIMCIQNLVLIGLLVFKILSKNQILTSIKGRNSVANLPKFELIQAFMHVLDTCKNEEDQIKMKALDRPLLNYMHVLHSNTRTRLSEQALSVFIVDR